MSTTSQSTDISLLDLIQFIWAAKKSILLYAFISLLGAILFISLAQPYYKAEMIIAPASPMNSSQLSSLLANDNLFAIRHLLQGHSNTNEFQSFEHILYGQEIAKILIQNEEIRKGVTIDQNYGAFGLGTFKELGKLTPAILSEYLSTTIKIQPIANTSFKRLSYKHPNPQFATFMLQELHRITDQKLRNKTNQNAAIRVEYLQNAILNTKNPEHRRALTTLLMEQERLKMLSSIKQSYAAAIIEPAASSAKPQWPCRSLILSLLTLCGAIIGFIVHNIAYSQTHKKHENSAAIPSQKKKEKI